MGRSANRGPRDHAIPHGKRGTGLYTALKGGGGPLTVGEVASATGLESREALAALRALEGREPPLAKRDVDEGRKVEVWIALLGD